MASKNVVDFDAPSKQVKSPSIFAHVVLRTNNLKNMRDFYLAFLGAKVQYENESLSFLTYDEEHHRVALLQIDDAVPKIRNSCGLEHIAFTFPTLPDLLLAYRQRLSLGINPVWCVNHGPTTSMYYKDPDGNVVETQVDNFDTADEANQFMMGKKFAENPIGADFDPEDLIARVKAGEDDRSLKARPEVGTRGFPEALLH